MSTILPHYAENLAAILPTYYENGDGVTIFRTNGDCLQVAGSIRTWLRCLARERAVDLSALKHHAQQETGQRILHILPLADDLVLVPVKARTPRVTRDNCTGYINACCVASVAKTDNRSNHCTIRLTTGGEISVLWSAATVEKYLRAARLVGRRRTAGAEQTDLLTISRKLVDVFQDILSLKAGF